MTGGQKGEINQMIGDNGIEVIDNFLDISDFRKISSKILRYDFPWFFYSHINTPEETYSDYNFQFVCPLYWDLASINGGIDFLRPIFQKLKVRSLIRVKCNLNVRTKDLVQYDFHVDYHFPDSKTAILYLNTNDGYTLFETGAKVESVENRLVKFNTIIPHTGTTCTNEKRRVLININYF